MSETVHILPDTARKAHATGVFKFWRLYALLKHYDMTRQDGTGRFPLSDDVLAYLRRYTHLTDATIKRILKHSDAPLFWLVEVTPQYHAPDDIYIRLNGRKNVELHLSDLAHEQGVLDAYTVSQSKALLTLADFKSLSTLAAQCFNAWIAVRTDSNAMLKYETLCNLWKVSKRTILRWIDNSDVRRVFNRGIEPKNAGNGKLSFFHENVNERLKDIGKYWLYQKANTFKTNDKARGKRATAKQVATHLRRSGCTWKRRIRTHHDLTFVNGCEYPSEQDRELAMYQASKSAHRKARKNSDKRHYIKQRPDSVRLASRSDEVEVLRWATWQAMNSVQDYA